MIIAQAYRRVACLLGLAAVLFVSAPPAVAQTGPELTALRERVSELYRAGKYGEAVPLGAPGPPWVPASQTDFRSTFDEVAELYDAIRPPVS
jgi:hypothetical protein